MSVRISPDGLNVARFAVTIIQQHLGVEHDRAGAVDRAHVNRTGQREIVSRRLASAASARFLRLSLSAPLPRAPLVDKADDQERLNGKHGGGGQDGALVCAPWARSPIVDDAARR